MMGNAQNWMRMRVQWQVLILATLEFHGLLLQLLCNLVGYLKKKKKNRCLIQYKCYYISDGNITSFVGLLIDTSQSKHTDTKR